VGADVTVVASSEGTQTTGLDSTGGFGRFGGDPIFGE